MLDINWIPCSIENWRETRKTTTFWIIKGNNSSCTGYFDNFDSLSDEEVDHFLEYKNCYYLCGKPCERDKYGNCDCVKLEENGSCVIDSISIEKNIENIIYFRKQLLNRIEQLKGEINSLSRSNNMNGINFG